MSYQSLAFVIFSAAVVLLYYLSGQKAQKWILVAANLAVYAMAGLQYLPFIFITMLATFLSGRKIGKIYQEADTQILQCTVPAEKKQIRNSAKNKAKRYLLMGMFVTIALLAICKSLLT